MKQKLLFLFVIISSSLIFLSPSCNDEETRPTFPFSVEIFHSTNGRQVAFSALTHQADKWLWDFGDGKNSIEKNPVHIYKEGGYYIASLTAMNKDGGTISKKVKLAIDLTPYALLTGDHTTDDYNGKTWKLSADHPTGGDYLANADNEMSAFKGTPKPLPIGIFDLQFGMGDVYKDEYTFFYDGSYKHDVKEDGASFSGLVYEIVTTGGAGIVNDNGKKYGLCNAKYTPEKGAKFIYKENDNLTITSAHSADGKLTFENVSTLDFSGTEFIGFRDFQRKIIVNSITDKRMQLTMFMAASDKAIGVNTHALILSFEVVNK